MERMESRSGAEEYPEELHYEIATSLGAFGVIRRTWNPDTGANGDPSAVGQRCYRVFQNRNTPCEGCPALRTLENNTTQTAVLRPRNARGGYLLTTARPGGPDAVRVSVRRVSDGVLSDLVHARADGLAERGKLSERERAVFDLLLTGSALDDISTALGITVRTVKFHQKNILEKLGADSRVDLFRVLI